MKAKLISGKWMYIQLNNGEAHRFVVNLINERGEFKKVYSKGAFSYDIDEAIARGEST